MHGTVKFFNDMKGYGFIATESGGDFFFHISRLVNKHEKLQVGMSVRFDTARPIRLGKADQAINVQVIHEDGVAVMQNTLPSRQAGALNALAEGKSGGGL